jgi:hypothetical protein
MDEIATCSPAIHCSNSLDSDGIIDARAMNIGSGLLPRVHGCRDGLRSRTQVSRGHIEGDPYHAELAEHAFLQ